MTNPHLIAELWRNDLCESVHFGHAVICDGTGDIVEAWGDPDAIIYPRSSCKMIQALPLLESGAAKAVGLSNRQLALACASHQGAALHTDLVAKWLNDLGLSESDLRCGAQWPNDKTARAGLILGDEKPCQFHNNCSGKHAGFLTLSQHLKAGPEYNDLDHPLQKLIRNTFEDLTGEVSPNYGIDGCSAPNFATSLKGLARAMGAFAVAQETDVRSQAMVQLRTAMMEHPDLVAGEGRACTELMQATGGRAAIKTGAEAVFVGIVPEKGLGIALKITDGSTRAAELAIAALLVRVGVLDYDHPATRKRLDAVQTNWRGIETGMLKAAEGFPG